ncbi:replication protein A 70 kDa DNA-binding subunit A [Syzygium oleosum]|uniref:replication protein A 70 kDa DNA-binding subunit A n=1 Tax=Syzygium oleosum TaxID=219896 RepID=UPI0024BBDE19|nr:replication protein A 70 kDa DNA-binding subunit A [Syzygium oleosum]
MSSVAAKLTDGAIWKICERELVGESEVKPVVQVVDMKMVKTPSNQNQNPSGGVERERQRFRMVLSDGTHMQQGMLATQHNHLVDSGRLQKGSIIRMNHFVCSPVKDRLIIVIVDLDVVLDKHDLIGEPVMAKVPGSEAAKPSLPTPSLQNTYGGSYTSNIDQGRYPATSTAPSYGNAAPVAPAYSNTEPGVPRSAQFGGSYTNQNMGFRNNTNEFLRTPVNTYAHQPQPSYQQPPPMYMNRGPIAKNEAPPRIIPIAALNPYQNRWTVKARVTAKGELRHYNNPRGDGKVFSFDLLDSDGGEIRVTCFNAVADQFYNQIETGKVYLISRGTLKPAQKNFNHLRNDHEIYLETTSIVQPCNEDDNQIPRQQFHFHPISDVEGMESNSIVDVIGVVHSINPVASIMRKNGSETQKRTLHLKDESGRSVELTLWGNCCNAEGQRLQILCDSGQYPVLAVKSGRVSDFNGKAVGTISTSQLFIEPDIEEARRLKEWFERDGKTAPTVSISREMTSMGRTDARKTISQIKDEKLGTSEKPDWITVSANIAYIKLDNFCYTACPIVIGDRQCNKKVTNNGDGKWRCDRCDRCVDECDYRYILQIQIQDHTGQAWVTAFQECGEEIMGVSAKELFSLRTEHEDERFGEIVRKVFFTKFLFKLKVKEEIFSDEQRVKSTVVKADKVNFSSEARFLLDLLEKNRADGSGSSDVKLENLVSNSGMNSILTGNAESKQSSSFAGNYSMGNNAGTGAYRSPANSTSAVQHGNQYNGARLSMTGPLDMNSSCTSCGRSGHSSTNCPSIMSGPSQTMGGAYMNRAPGGSGDTCYKCNQTGHWARDCPGLSAVPPAYGSSATTPGRYGMVSRERVGGF